MGSQSYEYCCECGEATGKAGPGEDSIYTDDGERGPFCERCYHALIRCPELEFDNARLTRELEIAKSFHDVAVKERDYERIQLDSQKALTDTKRAIIALLRKHVAYFKHYMESARQCPTCGGCVNWDASIDGTIEYPTDADIPDADDVERLTRELEAANKRADLWEGRARGRTQFINRNYWRLKAVGYRLCRWLRESHERTRAAKEEAREAREVFLFDVERQCRELKCEWDELFTEFGAPKEYAILALAKQEQARNEQTEEPK